MSSEKSEKMEETIYLGVYRIEKTIGEGSFGKVKIAYNQMTNEKVAVKIIDKSTIASEKQSKRIQKEIRFLKLLHHPHIIKIYDVEETSKEIFIFMEYAAGGELFEYLLNRTKLKEKEARKFFRQMVSAVEYCHSNCVTHRDLKLENLLLDENKNIKVIDFGFSNFFRYNSLLSTFCGSPMYAPPEMVLGIKYEGPEVDIWSMGVILYALLSGTLPFDDDNQKAIYRKIASCDFRIPEFFSHDCRDLIEKMIRADPLERATIEQIKNHKWVNRGHEFPPPSFLPTRQEIDLDNLDEEVIQKLLYSLGFSRSEIVAHLASNDVKTPTICSYHLISEMLIREKEKAKKMKRNSKVNQEPIALDLVKEEEDTLDIEEIIFQKTREKKYVKAIGDLTRTPSPTSISIPEKQVVSRRLSIQGNSFVVKNETEAATLPSSPTSTTPSPTPSPTQIVATVRESPISNPQPRRRRLSLPAIKIDFMKKSPIDTYPPSPVQTEKTDNNKKIRVIQGFLNISISSEKNPDELAEQVAKGLEALSIEYERDEFLFNCCENDKTVSFEVEICKVSKTDLNAIYFKRKKGNIWSYKKVINKLVPLMEP